jgi:NAD-specific glutamate dehydrogenase
VAQNLIAGLSNQASAADADKTLVDWAQANKDALARTKSFLAALETSGDLSIAKLTLAVSQIHKLSDI